MNAQTVSAPPTSATDSVLLASEPAPEGAQEVHGVDFDQYQGRNITVAELVDSLTHTGFQGSAVAEAARIINDMVGCNRCASACLLAILTNSDTFCFHSELIATLKQVKRRPFF